MPITSGAVLPLNSYPDFCLSNARQAAILAVAELKCDTPEDIDAARGRIMDMGIWDRFIDLACHRGEKREALRVIAEKVIADRVVEWAVETQKPSGEVLALEADRRVKQAAFVTMLTPEGLERVVERHRGNDELVRFTPCTDDKLVNRLLSIVVEHDLAAQLVRGTRGGRTTAFCYEQWASDARIPKRKAALYESAAREWSDEGEFDRSAAAWLKCAQAHGTAATLCIEDMVTEGALRAAHAAERRAITVCGYAEATARAHGTRTQQKACQSRKSEHELCADDYKKKLEKFESIARGRRAVPWGELE